MNKLLLLTIFLVSATFSAFSARPLNHYKQHINNFQPNPGDSIIKDLVLANPKSGFKDLFVSASSNGINMSKLNPKAISFVQDYISVHSNRLNRMKTWGRPYFDVISNILVKHNLPVELKYLSVIESDLKSSAVSWVGAVGPWQLMPKTARELGLCVNKHKDERTDYYKSTNAAARYLTDLYGIFNDWLLVIAAYNGGSGHVFSAIRKSGSRNFWDLQYYLPAESRNHVKKFIATHYIMEGDGGMTTLTKNETTDLSSLSAANGIQNSLFSISGKYNSIAVAQGVQMNFAEFNQLNPNFDKVLAETGSYNLNLPADKIQLFLTNKPQILEQSIRITLSMIGQ